MADISLRSSDLEADRSLMFSMMNLLRGWFGLVGELFVGLAGHIASTVPARTKPRKTAKRDEKHGVLQSETPVYYLFVKKSAADMYEKNRHFFGNFQHLSVLGQQFCLSFV